MPKSKSPKLSIIVPVHNVEDYVEECIESFIAQKFKDYEILLIENGSTDNSSEICDKLEQNYEKVRTIHTPGCGLAYARNYGLREASGEYVFFYDSDDLLPGECLNEIMQKIEQEQAEFMICNYCTFIDGEAEVTQGVFDVDEKKIQEGGIVALNEFFKHYIVSWSMCRVITRREYMLENNLFFNESFDGVEDGDLFFRIMFDCKKIGACKTNLLKYRLKRKNSITNTVSVKYMTTIFTVYSKWLKIISENYSKAQAEPTLRALSNALYYIMFSLSGAAEKDRAELYELCRKNIKALRYVSGTKKKIMYFVYRYLGIAFGVRLGARFTKNR